MLKIRRIYNQNKKSIWRIFGIVAFLLLLLYLVNFLVGKKSGLEVNEGINNNLITKDNKYKDITISNENSVISKERVSENNREFLSVIDDFFDFCNRKDYEKAYNLIAEECKKEMYPKIDDFIENYCQRVFENSKKIASVQLWRDNIYKIDINEDIIATGKYDKSQSKQEYIAVKEIQDGEYKLNINGYVGREEINAKGKFMYNIEVNVLSRDTYMDYEIYTLKVKNTTNGQILIDPLQEVNTMYIEDENNVKYFAYTHELSESQLLIEPGEESKLRIKYYSKSISEKKIKNIVFSRVIVNYYPSIIYTLFDDYQEFRIEL